MLAIVIVSETRFDTLSKSQNKRSVVCYIGVSQADGSGWLLIRSSCVSRS